jgi:glycosyltransferase involved in cell wall biosynthesis
VEEAFALASRVSFLAAATRRYYEPFCRDNSFLNPGWLDLSAVNAFRARHRTADLRSNLGLQPQERLVVNIGTVCDRKGQTLFARMVELLWQRDPITAATCRFVIVGARHSLYDAALQALIRDLGRTNLQIVPETGDVFSWYAAADIFVCSSFEESFPRVVLEAMGFGLGIVSTDVHAIPEIVRDGQEALLFPTGNTAVGADALHRLLTEPGLIQKLGTAARTRVESTYAIEQIFPQHQALAASVVPA